MAGHIVKQLRSQDTYAYLAYNHIASKCKFRMQKMSSYSHYASFVLFDKQFFMTFEMNPLLWVNSTSEESFENRLFNPFSFQNITGDESN